MKGLIWMYVAGIMIIVLFSKSILGKNENPRSLTDGEFIYLYENIK